MHFKCSICGNIFDDDKKISEVKCKSCKSDKVSVFKSKGIISTFFDKLKSRWDKITTFVGTVSASIMFLIFDFVSKFLYIYERDISGLIITCIILAIIMYLKTHFFPTSELYILGPIVIATFAIVRWRR